MTITEQKVKTIIAIELSLEDIRKAVSDYGKDGMAHRHARALDFVNPVDIDSVEDAGSWSDSMTVSFIEAMFLNGNGDTYNYLAQYFGFDGWENAGFFNKNRKVYCMAVFNYGDTLTPQFIKEGK